MASRNNQEGSSENKKKGLSSSSSVDDGVLAALVNNNPRYENKDFLSNHWTREEDVLLDDLLKRYETESRMDRYEKIAKDLKTKSILDVTRRVKWLKFNKNSEMGGKEAEPTDNTGSS